MKKYNRISLTLLACLFAVVSNVEAFTIPNGVTTDDFLVENILPPANSDPLFYSELLKKALAILHRYQQSVETCIQTLATTQGCDEGKHGIPSLQSISGDLESTKINVKDGVITLYPIVNNDLPTNIASNIIASPQYSDGKINWDYSGSLFDMDKIKYVQKQSTESLYCPDPATFPPSFKKFYYFVDLNGIKYILSGHKASTENDDSISFLWAAYPGKKETTKIACVYKIGNDPSLTTNWFSLTTVEDAAEIPQDGLWNTVQRGVCPTTNTLSAVPKVSDCPFKLKISAKK